ncbi:MAG: 30S ribosomal protein S6 [Endomicrobium sp.]|jgi:small subunit ribosomal protein S6|uniref:30S ribosomal protein S6 n=1 Tax=Candidatus Endomicrobiellum cubanum TaxID=3242325 RepID=UPI002829841E|nr:30S ribosomal protein S6 [Endomicrobium sp.]
MNYESTFIVCPELPVENVEEITAKVIKLVESAKGVIKSVQQIGKKRLAYSINKFREGSYVFMELTGTGELVSALEKFFKFNDAVIRFMIVKVDKKRVVKKPAKDVKSEEAKLQTKPQAVEVK